MADLFMTVDSDSDTPQQPKKKTQKQPKEKQDEDEQIMLSHSVFLQDEQGPIKGQRKHTSGAIMGSNNLWSFTQSLRVDKNGMGEDDFEFGNNTTADEKAPFLQTMEDRVELKMKHYGIKIPDELKVI